MPTIKANTEVIRKALKGPKARYAIAGHEGFYLHTRTERDENDKEVGNGSYLVRYRAAGKRRFHTLHRDARNAMLSDVIEAKNKWLAEIAITGADPKAEREAQIAAKLKAEREAKLTLGTVIDEWIAKPREKALRPRTVKLYRWIFDSYVVPDFGKRPIAEIAKPELAKHFAKLRDRLQASGGRSGEGTRGEMAGKAFTYLAAVFEYAFDQEYIVRSPMIGLARPVPKEPERKRSRPLRPDELRRVWLGADAHLEPAFARMIKLALLLGRRRSEIAGAEISELHIEGEQPHWLIAPRDGNKSALPSLCPLPPMAMNLIRQALANREENSAFVFPRARGESDRTINPDSMSHAWAALLEAVDVPREVTLHDARGLITDNLETMGVPDNIVSHVLHHTADMKSTTAKRVYSTNSFRAEKLRALRLWELRIKNIVAGTKLHRLEW